jgi:hypothetical protein
MSLPTEDMKRTLGAALKLLKIGPEGTSAMGIHSGFQTTRTSLQLPLERNLEWRSASIACTSQSCLTDAMDDGDVATDSLADFLASDDIMELHMYQ